MQFLRQLASVGGMLFLALIPQVEEAGAARNFSQECVVVESVVLPYLKERNIEATKLSCPEGSCYSLGSDQLLDAERKKVSAARVEKEFSVKTARRTPGPGWWISWGKMEFSGELRMTSEKGGCKVSLRHQYRTPYSALFFLVMPVDGDPVSFRSNLILEKQFLDGVRAR